MSKRTQQANLQPDTQLHEDKIDDLDKVKSKSGLISMVKMLTFLVVTFGSAFIAGEVNAECNPNLKPKGGGITFKEMMTKYLKSVLRAQRNAKCTEKDIHRVAALVEQFTKKGGLNDDLKKSADGNSTCTLEDNMRSIYVKNNSSLCPGMGELAAAPTPKPEADIEKKSHDEDGDEPGANANGDENDEGDEDDKTNPTSPVFTKNTAPLKELVGRYVYKNREMAGKLVSDLIRQDRGSRTIVESEQLKAQQDDEKVETDEGEKLMKVYSEQPKNNKNSANAALKTVNPLLASNNPLIRKGLTTIGCNVDSDSVNKQIRAKKKEVRDLTSSLDVQPTFKHESIKISIRKLKSEIANLENKIKYDNAWKCSSEQVGNMNWIIEELGIIANGRKFKNEQDPKNIKMFLDTAEGHMKKREYKMAYLGYSAAYNILYPEIVTKNVPGEGGPGEIKLLTSDRLIDYFRGEKTHTGIPTIQVGFNAMVQQGDFTGPDHNWHLEVERYGARIAAEWRGNPAWRLYLLGGLHAIFHGGNAFVSDRNAKTQVLPGLSDHVRFGLRAGAGLKLTEMLGINVHGVAGFIPTPNNEGYYAGVGTGVDLGPIEIYIQALWTRFFTKQLGNPKGMLHTTGMSNSKIPSLSAGGNLRF